MFIVHQLLTITSHHTTAPESARRDWKVKQHESVADRHRHALINDQIAALIPWWRAKYFFLISECDIYTETGAYSWDETGERCTFAICSGFSPYKEVKLLIFYRRSLSWASAYHFLSHWLFSSPSSLLILSLSVTDVDTTIDLNHSFPAH